MKCQCEVFYRPASRGSPREDTAAVNECLGIYLVADGVSGPYSPSNPPHKYLGDMTGGQMVSSVLKETIESISAKNLYSALEQANERVLSCHRKIGKDPLKEAVAGACVAACQIKQEKLAFTVAGDSWVFWRKSAGACCISNFDLAAFELEEAGDKEFERCKSEAGSIGKAWDLYYPYFSSKQFTRANRNLRMGGHAMLNGDPAFLDCYRHISIPHSGISWIVLCTDGLLPKSTTHPDNQNVLANEFSEKYEQGGIAAVIKWRDSFPSEPHIGKGHWPEATAIELKF